MLSSCLGSPLDGRSGGASVLGILLHGLEDVLDPHAVPEIRVNKARFDAAVPANHDGCGDRQQPAAISVELLKVDTEALVHGHDLSADPEHET